MADYKIIGAGIQGCCIALELANHGKKVTLIERDKSIFNRASLRNEGKIHLGLVYMNDPTFKTPYLMLKGALLFRKSLERWIRKDSYNLGLSEPFYYLVAKDSFLSADELEAGYQKLQDQFEEWKILNPNWDYLGTRPEKLFQRKPQKHIQNIFGNEVVEDGFQTAELAVDTSKLKEHLSKAVYANKNIEVLHESKVDQIEQKGDHFLLSISSFQQYFTLKSEHVINCAWDGKYVLDHQMGLPLPPELLHRLKYRVIVSLPKKLTNMPSATMVIGKFGDVVNQKNNKAYLSWYPSACRGWSHNIAPPDDWEEAAQGNVPSQLANNLSSEFLDAIDKWYPGISESKPEIIDAGPIVAYGKTDVDDSQSSLHFRSELGFKSVGNYHSIETGKLTTAPMIAVDFVNSILE
ncbi:FAD-dependent oxidoreductase [Algoriphagus limi]|uniref:FAD-binding oxidoreductase n=1 Tax=Algoriphagus limi TaxID=2975273 RepID=A0ABT2G7C3_9BACT|nr:FAD-dependent oxidoreductase [Algoriphagus limi]MCS5491175.1 FAD-binding oxidoreductase [Algoriphagus limi]